MNLDIGLSKKCSKEMSYVRGLWYSKLRDGSRISMVYGSQLETDQVREASQKRAFVASYSKAIYECSRSSMTE